MRRAFAQWGRVEVRRAGSGGAGFDVCAERECGESGDGVERLGAGGRMDGVRSGGSGWDGLRSGRRCCAGADG